MTTLTHNPDRYPHNGGNADLDLLCRACEMGVPRKRAMPGPPEHRPNAHPPGDGSDGWCPICHHLHARRPVGSNRLTAAEAAAEFWSALCSAQFIEWAPPRELGIHVPADGQMYEVKRPDPEPAYKIAETWHRFAALPHALEVDA